MKQRFRRRIYYTLLVVFDKLFNLLPLKLGIWIGRQLGTFTYYCLRHYTNIAKSNISMAFDGTYSRAQVNQLTLKLFQHLGMNAAEILNVHKIKKRVNQLFYAEGFEKIDAALSKGKGAIILSGHFGNWELLPVYFVAKGYPSNVIARQIYYEKYNDWLAVLRSSTGVNIIYRDESPKKMISVLKKNELLGIMPDQDIDSVEGVFVDFFGIPAYTPVAPVSLAMRMDCPILPCFIIRDKGKHKIMIEDPVNLVNTGNWDDDVKTNTQCWSAIFESYIRKYPEQWAWVHKRWKTKPIAK